MVWRPAGMESRTARDAMGRIVFSVTNFVAGATSETSAEPCGVSCGDSDSCSLPRARWAACLVPGDEANIAVGSTFDSGRQTRLTAYNPSTGGAIK